MPITVAIKKHYAIFLRERMVLIFFYYDTTSGLKIQTDMGAQGGTVSYTDYTSYEGIMLPKKIIVKSPQLPVALEFVTQEVKINKGIDDSRFN